jgi:hypothetical protein
MKIIEYKTNNNDFCIVHKTKMFIYYLVFKNNNYYYYESYSFKNYNKTKKVCSKLLKKDIVKTIISNHDDFILSYKADDYLSKIKNDYHLVAETFGNDNCITFCILKDFKKIKEFKGQKYSPTFIFSYVLYKFGFNISPHFHSYGDFFTQDINEKDKKKLRKYAGIMFYKYMKYNFSDININFKFFMYSLNERFLFKNFIHYDSIIKININRINDFFNLNDNQKKINYIYYAMSYFSSLFFIDFIKKNNIKNCNVSINSCLFKIELCKTFFDNTNNYYFSSLNNLKNGWMFFIDDKYNKSIKLIKDKYKINMIKKVQKITI